MEIKNINKVLHSISDKVKQKVGGTHTPLAVSQMTFFKVASQKNLHFF
jgi:hypothetical protein